MRGEEWLSHGSLWMNQAQTQCSTGVKTPSARTELRESWLPINSTITRLVTFIIALSRIWRWDVTQFIHHFFVLGFLLDTELEAFLIYLQFNTKYYYVVGIGHTPRKFWFVTPPKVGPDVPYTFGLIGNRSISNLCNWDCLKVNNS